MNWFKKKKKLDTVQFWKNKVDYLFSEKFDEYIKRLYLIESNLLNTVSITHFKNELIAAYIELLGVSLTKNISNRDKLYEVLFLRDTYIKSKDANFDTSVIEKYNREFGSSFTDGVRPMARYFSEKVQSGNKKQLEHFVYELFYATLEVTFMDIKNLNLI